MADNSLEAFEQEARAFLDGHASRREEERAFVWGEGSDKVAIFEEKARDREREELAKAQEWRATKFDAGFGWITGPEAYGGRELPAPTSACGARSRPLRHPQPGVLRDRPRHGGADDPGPRHRHGEGRATCAASTAATSSPASCSPSPAPAATSPACRPGPSATATSGCSTAQKVWTSGAQYSDIGEIIGRTDPDLPKHKGLTGFVVDMHAPGVEVRPLRQMTGGASFNEVFFNDVRVPDDHRLGDVNDGWGVALTTLMNERAAIGAGGGRRHRRRRGAPPHRDGPPLRSRRRPDRPPASSPTSSPPRVARYTNQRAMDKIARASCPARRCRIAKLSLTPTCGASPSSWPASSARRLIADTGEWGTFAWAQLVLGVPGMRIAGGTDEVMRNIVGERVLGLPKDPGIDAMTPFRDLKVGTQKS